MIGFTGLFIWMLTVPSGPSNLSQSNWVQTSVFYSTPACERAIKALGIDTTKARCIEGVAK